MQIRDRLGISVRNQRRLAQAMESSLVGMVFIGLYIGRLGIVINAGIGVLVTQLVPMLERDYQIPMDPGLVLWITTAVFLHALGTIPLPADVVGVVATVPPDVDRISLYSVQGGWDHLTHAISSSLVAAVGYSTVRALDLHSEDIHIPPRYTFVFVVLFVLAFGVLWEVIEFSLNGVSQLTGTGSVLTQYGPDDTLRDLVFDVVGAILVGAWGTAYLTDVVGAIRSRLDGYSDTR